MQVVVVLKNLNQALDQAEKNAQAVVLSGGSAYGLDTATGVMRYLEEGGIGFQTRADFRSLSGAAPEKRVKAYP